MTVTSERTQQNGQAGEPDRGRNPAVAALLAALQAVAGGLLALIVPALAIWMATPRVSVAWPESVALAVNAWVLGHGAPLSLASGTVDVVPLGLLLPLLWVAWSGAVRVVRAVERRTPGRARALIGPGAVYVGTYGVLATVLAGVAGSEDVRASLGAVLLSSALVTTVALAIAGQHLWWPRRPEAARLSLLTRGAVVMLLGWLGLALVVLVGAVAVGVDRIIDVQQAVHPGGLGHVLLVLLQLVLVPTAWVWSAAYVTGAGFTVGEGTTISPFGTELAPLPAVPLLGALPESGAHPVQAVLFPLLVVAAGAVGGYWVRQRRGSLSTIDHVLDAVLVALLAVAAVGILAALSSGGIGPGRMADLGPRVGWLVVASSVELVAGALFGTFAGPHLASGRAVASLGRASSRLGGRGGSWARGLVSRLSQAARGVFAEVAIRARRLGAVVAGRARGLRRPGARSTSSPPQDRTRS